MRTAFILIALLLTLSPNQAFASNIELVEPLPCPQCAEPDADWRRYANAAIRECFESFEPTTFVGSIFDFVDEDSTCAEALSAIAGDSDSTRLQLRVCGFAHIPSPLTEADCAFVDFRYEYADGFEIPIGASYDANGLEPSIGIPIQIAGELVGLILRVIREGSILGTVDVPVASDGDIIGGLPSVEPSQLPYPNGSFPTPGDPNGPPVPHPGGCPPGEEIP